LDVLPGTDESGSNQTASGISFVLIDMNARHRASHRHGGARRW
jgi:hypothetical protein